MTFRTFKILTFLFIITAFTSCKIQSVTDIKILKEGKVGWTTKDSCQIIYNDGDKEVKLTGGIKCRGGMSRKYYKHSYTIELDQNYKLGGLAKDDDWIFNANYIDKTFMRHKICYDLYREMDKNNIAPKCSYANISLNNKYKGLFIVMEKLNASMIGVNKKDSLAMVFKDPPVFYEERFYYVQDTNNYYHQKYPKKKHN